MPEQHKHCYHYFGGAIGFQNPNGKVSTFPQICCFCAPEWLRIESHIMIQSKEQLAEVAKEHGPRVKWVGEVETGIVKLPPGARIH
jgi:hypothetical protein